MMGYVFQNAVLHYTQVIYSSYLYKYHLLYGMILREVKDKLSVLTVIVCIIIKEVFNIKLKVTVKLSPVLWERGCIFYVRSKVS